MIHTYIFELGHQPHISAAEIKAVFSAFNLSADYTLDNKHLVIESDKELDIDKVMKRLGGTIKIGEEIQGDERTQAKIISHIQTSQPDGKINFSLADKKLALQIKKELKSVGRNVRYIEPKNTATILHNSLIQKQGDYTMHSKHLFVTRAIQPIEEFTDRDYGRPGADSKSGMLPPKLAKILVNLTGAKLTDNILDPFCGSGTVLTEATVMGFKNLIGSDASSQAIEDTKQNMKWIIEKYGLANIKYEIHKAEVRNVAKILKQKSVDAIVTEPYMGKPFHGNESSNTINQEITKVSAIYIQAFQAFHEILKNDGMAVFIFPSYRSGSDWMNTVPLNEIKNTGFEPVSLTDESEFLRYHRPDQHIARDIWKFKKI